MFKSLNKYFLICLWIIGKKKLNTYKINSYHSRENLPEITYFDLIFNYTLLYKDCL